MTVELANQSALDARYAPIGNGGGPAFPVGAVFIAVVATDPATLLGYGTWAAFGAGRVLVGLDAADTDFDTSEKLSGAKTKTISAHSGGAVADHAAHTHSVTGNVAVADHASHTHTSASSTATPKLVTGNTSTGVSIVTGAPSAALSHSVTNNAVTSGSPSATLSHSVTQPSTHTDLNVVQPSITVYFWKRTA